jgi:hypothetical protein
MVDESPFGTRFAAKFPATEIFLSRVGHIGLTNWTIGHEQGRELCAGSVEAFLMEQVENGTFQLSEEKEGDACATISTFRASQEIDERLTRHQIDDNVNRFVDNMNHHIIANEANLKTSETPVLTNRSPFTGAAGLIDHMESEPLVTEPNSIKSQSSVCVFDSEESTSTIVKQESTGQRLGLHVDEHKTSELANLKQELVDDVDNYKSECVVVKYEPNGNQLDFEVDKRENVELDNMSEDPINSDGYEEVANTDTIERANAANIKVAAAMKAQMLAEASRGAPVITKQELECLELSN